MPIKKKVNTRAKGDRYYKKVKLWLEAQGYLVTKMEMTKLAYFNGRFVPVRSDIWASDGMAANETEHFLFQVKSKSWHKADAVNKYNKLPSGIKWKVIVWEPRMKEPRVFERALPSTLDLSIPHEERALHE